MLQLHALLAVKHRDEIAGVQVMERAGPGRLQLAGGGPLRVPGPPNIGKAKRRVFVSGKKFKKNC